MVWLLTYVCRSSSLRCSLVCSPTARNSSRASAVFPAFSSSKACVILDVTSASDRFWAPICNDMQKSVNK